MSDVIERHSPDCTCTTNEMIHMCDPCKIACFTTTCTGCGNTVPAFFGDPEDGLSINMKNAGGYAGMYDVDDVLCPDDPMPTVWFKLCVPCSEGLLDTYPRLRTALEEAQYIPKKEG